MAELFDPNKISGLSSAEAERRLREEGYNELPSSQARSLWTIIWEVVREPMFLMLVAGGLIYLIMGREHIGDALMLLGFVFVIIGITVYQERRTERALEALRDLSSPRALVIRDGLQTTIAGREVVRGDFAVISEGDRVPADAVVRYALNLSADESLLTGESLPVRKRDHPEGTPPPAPPGGDGLPQVYSGTLVTRGQGVIEVSATGLKTELGKIGKSLQSLETEATTLQKETGRLVRVLAAVGLSLCALVVVMYGISRGNTAAVWEQGFLAGITMAMATIPEEFPVVLTIFLAMGAWRISQNRVLTRRVPAIETLGAATVLCVDKTGTLTENRMAIRKLWAEGESIDIGTASASDLSEAFHSLLEYGILSSKAEPFDPMEKAIKNLGADFLARTEHLHADWRLIREYPLSPELLALSHVWNSPDGKELVIAAKGAPEAIGDLCHFDERRKAELIAQTALLAEDGLRVLGVAKGLCRQSDLPAGQHDFEFHFLGLIGLADPVRSSVPSAIQECYRAGVRVIMITGDYPGTAQNIARQIGLKNPEQYISGPQLSEMSDEELIRRIPQVNIFARVVPEQKLRIVNALKANREIVAMTGDGVNDAPALKAAHIGIAMGKRGTDVAREASALVLLDDDFSSIVQAIRLGRRIFDNIKKAIAYIFAIHVPIAGLSLIPVFFKEWPLLLLPVHVVFLELIIDPSCSVVFEAEEAEPNVMQRPPRDPKEKLFNLGSIGFSILQGAVVLATVLTVYYLAGYFGHAGNESRAMVFVTLIIANLALILANRSWTQLIVKTLKVPNTALYWVLGGAGVFLGLVLFVPFLNRLFQFAPISLTEILICLAVGGSSILWFEAFKLFNKTRRAF